MIAQGRARMPVRCCAALISTSSPPRKTKIAPALATGGARCSRANVYTRLRLTRSVDRAAKPTDVGADGSNGGPDRAARLAGFFPVEHRAHLRTTNPIGSRFATCASTPAGPRPLWRLRPTSAWSSGSSTRLASWSCRRCFQCQGDEQRIGTSLREPIGGRIDSGRCVATLYRVVMNPGGCRNGLVVKAGRRSPMPMLLGLHVKECTERHRRGRANGR